MMTGCNLKFVGVCVTQISIFKLVEVASNARNADNSNLVEDVVNVFVRLIHHELYVLGVQVLQVDRLHLATHLLAWFVVRILKLEGADPQHFILVVLA